MTGTEKPHGDTSRTTRQHIDQRSGFRLCGGGGERLTKHNRCFRIGISSSVGFVRTVTSPLNAGLSHGPFLIDRSRLRRLRMLSIFQKVSSSVEGGRGGVFFFQISFKKILTWLTYPMGTTLRERPRIRTTKRKEAPWQHEQISNDSAAHPTAMTARVNH